MTLYDAIVKEIAAGKTKIPITCTKRGKGILRGIYPGSVYPINVRFEQYEGEDHSPYSESFTEHGINSGECTIALGHYDSPEDMEEAIAERQRMQLLPIETAPFNQDIYIYNEKYMCMPIARREWICVCENCDCLELSGSCEGYMDNAPMVIGWKLQDEQMQIGERDGLIFTEYDKELGLMPTHWTRKF